MKVGDRVKLKKPQYTLVNHQVGDEGVIVAHHWDNGDISMFGVQLDHRPNPWSNTDPDGWSYASDELELL